MSEKLRSVTASQFFICRSGSDLPAPRSCNEVESESRFHRGLTRNPSRNFYSCTFDRKSTKNSCQVLFRAFISSFIQSVIHALSCELANYSNVSSWRAIAWQSHFSTKKAAPGFECCFLECRKEFNGTLLFR